MKVHFLSFLLILITKADANHLRHSIGRIKGDDKASINGIAGVDFAVAASSSIYGRRQVVEDDGDPSLVACMDDPTWFTLHKKKVKTCKHVAKKPEVRCEEYIGAHEACVYSCNNCPSSSPSVQPTSQPTIRPTSAPTTSPSEQPTTTMSPSKEPTNAPTSQPTIEPTIEPTKAPSEQPSASTYPSEEPTTAPSVGPSTSPSRSPSPEPSSVPTSKPSVSPTPSPTISPTAHPTDGPTASPTFGPTIGRTTTPSMSPAPTPGCPDNGFSWNPESGQCEPDDCIVLGAENWTETERNLFCQAHEDLVEGNGCCAGHCDKWPKEAEIKLCKGACKGRDCMISQCDLIPKSLSLSLSLSYSVEHTQKSGGFGCDSLGFSLHRADDQFLKISVGINSCRSSERISRTCKGVGGGYATYINIDVLAIRLAMC